MNVRDGKQVNVSFQPTIMPYEQIEHQFKEKYRHFFTVDKLEMLLQILKSSFNHHNGSNEKWMKEHVKLLQDIIDSIICTKAKNIYNHVQILFHTLKENVFSMQTSDYIYFDINDITMIQEIPNEQHEMIVIGIDHHFIKAVNQCLKWDLHHVTYHTKSCFDIQLQSTKPICTLSAVGLLKRILPYNQRNKVTFVFKNHEQIQLRGMKILADVFETNISVNLSSMNEAKLEILPALLKNYLEYMIHTYYTSEYVVIKLVNIPTMEKRYILKEIVDMLKKIQSSTQYGKDTKIMIQKDVSHTNYAICDIQQYEPIVQMAPYQVNKSIMDYITEEWRGNSLMLSI